MIRHYYISDDLDDLERIENELEQQGLTKNQIHVLSENDAEVEKHHLHAIAPLLKRDVVHSTLLGALTGLVIAAMLLSVVYLLDLHLTPLGWLPFIFAAVVILGFCIWEGGLIGLQIPNYQFKRFQKLLDKGNHVFFVDTKEDQEAFLSQVIKKHPKLRDAGTNATPQPS